MNRRNFLHTSLSVGALSILQAKAWANPEHHKAVGLQLYTLRDDIQKQGIEKIIVEIAKLGYKKVENFGYGQGKFFKKTPAEYSQLLKDNGLEPTSGHYMTGRVGGMDGLNKNWQQIIDDAAMIGQKYAIIAYLMPNERKADDYKQLFELINKGEEISKKAGIEMGYHNHDFEFVERIDGEKPYNLLLKNTKIKMEMDMYWVVKANEKPEEYFMKYPGRFPLWHLKDMANTPEKEFAEVGSGSIDFGAIFKHAKKAGLKQYFVEQDVCKRPALESVKMSIDYIEKAKWG